MDRCTITYGATRHSFDAPYGTRLLDAILTYEPGHLHVCGGHGFCTSCRVRVISGEGLSPPNRLERERLGSRCGPLRLACQTRVVGDVEIEPGVRASLIDW